MASICFVGCVKGKRAEIAPAEHLYISDLFRKSRLVASTKFSRWYILSAKYGVLEPQRPVAPYEVTLNTMDITARRNWATTVLQTILNITAPQDHLVFLTGQRYHKHLIRPLMDRGYTIELPLDGMGIGKRLQWLNMQIGDGSLDR